MPKAHFNPKYTSLQVVKIILSEHFLPFFEIYQFNRLKKHTQMFNFTHGRYKFKIALQVKNLSINFFYRKVYSH
ncbi:hypothetical protein CBW18_16950 [Pedobacter sp. AJM]|jgi:hypothetical protein|nr:hypothetical protein CBW18_16950 [Pedobacter sp. AJM]